MFSTALFKDSAERAVSAFVKLLLLSSVLMVLACLTLVWLTR